MTTELQRKCDLFAENRQIIRKSMPFCSDYMAQAAAILFTEKDLCAEPEKLKACKTILKANAGIFSDFRGLAEELIICKMALAEDPEHWFEEFRETYRILKGKSWLGSEYKLLAAIAIYEYGGIARAEYYADRTNQIYQAMKEKHRWLTGDEDMPMAALLAVTNLPPEQLVDSMESAYEYTKKAFPERDARQTLSHVLSLDRENLAQKCEKTMEIHALLKEKRHRYGSGRTIAVLGSLGSCEASADVLSDEIIEADEYLRTKKGFGNFTMGSEIRRMHAAMLTAQVNQKAGTANSTALTEQLLAIIQIEICMTIMIITICATSSSAANS